jgi:Arc/MetJ family transcription regulator
VAKTLVDIPAEKLAEAQAVLGTTSKRSTVEAALDLVLLQARQRAMIEAVAAGEVASDFTPEFFAQIRA